MGINHRLEQVAQMAYSTKATVFNTYALALEAVLIPGCFVECGVGAGAQLMAMALTYSSKQIYGFDSFEGIPLSGKHDDQQPGIGVATHNTHAPVKERLVSSGVTVHSVDNVLGNFEKQEIGAAKIKLVKGWFQHTLPKADTGPIALLRLDGDLYESTLVCLEYLYPLVSPGGIVIIDDYALPGCMKAVHNYFNDDLPHIISVEGGEGVVYFYKN